MAIEDDTGVRESPTTVALSKRQRAVRFVLIAGTGTAIGALSIGMNDWDSAGGPAGFVAATSVFLGYLISRQQTAEAYSPEAKRALAVARRAERKRTLRELAEFVLGACALIVLGWVAYWLWNHHWHISTPTAIIIGACIVAGAVAKK